jgi:diketogulonate reductase-like aldo/keto reductase
MAARMPPPPPRLRPVSSTARLEGRAHVGPRRAGAAGGFRGIDTANQRRHYFEGGVGRRWRAATRAGVVTRADLFLQQVHVPQRPGSSAARTIRHADLTTQVAQSMASSLEHLGTDHVDSYVLHGPPPGTGGPSYDAEVWAAMVAERDAGRTRSLGVSNVSRATCARCGSGAESARRSCRTAASPAGAGIATCARSASEHSIVYQGFSLLTGQPRGAGPSSLVAPTDRDAAGGRRHPRSCSGSRSGWGCLPPPPGPPTAST